MNKRLFIAGLPFSSNEEDIKTHFSAAGNVTMIQLITDKMTGRPKGFGFIEYEKEEEAAKAITMFHETDFGGRKLIVAEAKPMEKREFTPRFSAGDERRSGSKSSFSGGKRDSRGGGDRSHSDRSNNRGFSRGGGRDGFSNQ